MKVERRSLHTIAVAAGLVIAQGAALTQQSEQPANPTILPQKLRVPNGEKGNNHGFYLPSKIQKR